MMKKIERYIIEFESQQEAMAWYFHGTQPRKPPRIRENTRPITWDDI